MAKTRPSSSESLTESPESMGSTDRGVDASPPCGSNVLSPSKTGYSKRDFMMRLPEEKLKHFDSRAQAHEDNQECDACIQDLVRCVALTRLVYGDGHLKLAQAHVRLAKAYFQLKGWGLQAQEHSAQARELLSVCSSISSGRGEKHEFLTCLLSVHLTRGGAALLTANLEEAESSFLEAEQVLKELPQHGAINQEEMIKTELEISTGLCRIYKRQSRPDKALSQCERSLQLLKDCDTPEKTCSVYRDMAAIEQDRGHLDRAIEHLSKAHAISMSHSPEELEGAQISHSLALILSAAAEPHHNDSADQYFEQSLRAYKNSVGPQDPAFLTAQDDFCRFLLLNGQQERCVEIQRASLILKRSTFGDLSAEVADTLQLIGSVEMTEGRMIQAHRTMTKCLEIQNWMYGPQHKKTKATQKAVDMLARAPAVAERLQRQGFGPFRQFLVNPSWKAAQGLKLVGLGERIDVHIKEVPVTYIKTQQIIADIWQTLNPKFAVHLGIARGSSVIILEQTGKNSGYRDKDVCGFCPANHCCMEGGPEKLCSVINMRAVSKQFKEAGADVIYSRDAGRYLCDFAYYCSLYHGQGRAALIHIPTSGSLASADSVVPLLQTLIQTMLDQLGDPSETA